MRHVSTAALEFRAMNNFPQYTDMSPEIREASAKINAAYERFKAYAQRTTARTRNNDSDATRA
jgi:hypothetical protein